MPSVSMSEYMPRSFLSESARIITSFMQPAAIEIVALSGISSAQYPAVAVITSSGAGDDASYSS